jgi:hypothetical protein
MIRATVLVSGDPLSLSRGAEETKMAIEAELSFYGLEDEIQVGYTGRMNAHRYAARGHRLSRRCSLRAGQPPGWRVHRGRTPVQGPRGAEPAAPPEVSAESVITLSAAGDTALRAKARRAAARRRDRPLQHRGLHRPGRLLRVGKALTEMTPAEVLDTVKRIQLAGARRRGLPHRPEVVVRRGSRPRTSSTSSATPTNPNRARSRIATSWRAIPTPSWKGWRWPGTPWARAKVGFTFAAST